MRRQRLKRLCEIQPLVKHLRDRRKDERRLLRCIVFLFILVVSVNFINSIQYTRTLQPQSWDDAWNLVVANARNNPAVARPLTYPKILLYITTHMSETHIRYLHCCWPILIRDSPLVQRAHILVASTTPQPQSEIQTELDYMASLFSHNPSYTYWTPENFTHMKFCEVYKTPRDNSTDPPDSYKQCLANYGVSAGLHLLKGYDWVIRLNPDVLIRQSSFFLNAMSNNSTLDALLINCAPGTKKIHTDFWAIRPQILSNFSFKRMIKVRSEVNHERTAFRAFRSTIEANRHAWVPNVEPSNRLCRVRGPKAPVYHAHDSCTSNDDMICHALQGWNVAL